MFFLFPSLPLVISLTHAWKESGIWTGAVHICAGDAVMHSQSCFAETMHVTDGRVICAAEVSEL